MGILIYIIALPILGILVFVHELGHYIMAKINGIGVDVFSLGFGKEVLGFTSGETRYRLSIIPFGGYCKLRGEESKDRDDKTESDPRAWLNKPPLSRLLTSIAGPFFNYVFAVILLSILLYVGYKAVYLTSQVEVLDDRSAPAMISGLRSGDTILSIDNKKIEKFDDILPAVMFNVNKKLELTYLHNGSTNHTHVVPIFNTNSGAAYIGVSPLFYCIVGSVISNTPAFMAGIQPGDEIRSIDNVKTDYFYKLHEYLSRKTNGERVTIVISRPDKILTNRIITNSVILAGLNGRGYLGIEPDPSQSPRVYRIVRAVGVYPAFAGGLKEADDLIILTYKGIQAMVIGKIDVRKSVAGPLRILQFTGTIATRADLWYFIWFIAYISIALGFANLLPLPGLDGGHAIISVGEVVSGRKLPDRVRERIEIAGVIFIILLAIFVTQNDIINMFFGR